MTIETEAIDKLFLELSQVTQAVTAKELALDFKVQKMKACIRPFAELVKTTDGRIPVERLSLADWHELVKAYDNA